MNIIKCFFVILFSLISAWAICQSQMVYSCDFEDGENLNDWLFVTDSTSSNAWVIGNADASSGSNSLYLSTNSGTTASYDKAHASVVMACLTLPLEAAKEYSLVFDAFACGGSSADKLSICIITDSTISVTAVGGTQLPAWYSNCVVDSLSNSTYRTNKSISLQGTGANVRVVFVWENGVDLSSTGSGAMIDNVVVYETITSGCTLDFDSPAEQAEWRILNNASNPNKWVFGSATALEGHTSLYVSADSGANMCYENHTGWVIASRTLVLKKGLRYNLTFNWRSAGNYNELTNQVNDFMMVGCLPNDNLDHLIGDANVYPSWLDSYAKPVNKHQSDQRYLVHYNRWEEGQFVVTGTGRPMTIIFLWYTSSSRREYYSCAVDNVEVNEISQERVTGLVINDTVTGLSLQWDASVTGRNVYEVSYQAEPKIGKQKGLGSSWQSIKTSSNSCFIPDLKNGKYVVRVRRLCDSVNTIYSNWTTQSFTRLKGKERGMGYHFTDIINNSQVTTHYGNFREPLKYVNNDISHDHYNNRSLHTIVDMQVRDTFVYDFIPTLSVNRDVSVRLGKPHIAVNEPNIAAVKYQFVVDSIYNVITIRLDGLRSIGHMNSYDSYVDIYIVDRYGYKTNPRMSCSFNYNSPQEAMIYENYNYYNVLKDKVVTFDLFEEIGRTVDLHIVASACEMNKHEAYIYYNIDFSEGTLRTDLCNSQETYCAPDSFRYEWYRVSNGSYLTSSDTIISRNQCLPYDAQNRDLYACLLFSGTNLMSERTFYLGKEELRTSTSVERLYTQCKNRVKFKAESSYWIDNIKNTSLQTDKRYYWDFGNGSTALGNEVVVEYDLEGGTYEVMLIVFDDDNRCNDTLYQTLQIDPFNNHIWKPEVHICDGENYQFNGRNLTQPGLYVDSLVSDYGCDSIIHLTLIKEPHYMTYDTLVITNKDLPLNYANVTLDKSIPIGVSNHFFSLESTYGCDSLVALNLTVNDKTGLEELSDNGISLYPNPLKVNSELTIRMPQGYVNRVTIYNSVGLMVYDGMVKEEALVWQGTSEKGVYIISFETKQGVVNKKIVIE